MIRKGRRRRRVGVPGPWEGRLLSEAAWIALRVEGGGERQRPGPPGLRGGRAWLGAASAEQPLSFPGGLRTAPSPAFG